MNSDLQGSCSDLELACHMHAVAVAMGHGLPPAEPGPSITIKSTCSCGRCIQGISGSGVLLFDPARRQVILVQDHTDMFNDCGGQLQRKGSLKSEHTIAETAAAELQEETRGVVMYSSQAVQRLPYVTLEHRRAHKGVHTYRCYVLHLPYSKGICTMFRQTDVLKLPDCWQETTEMERFDLAQFEAAEQTRTVPHIGTTVRGKRVPLHARGAHAIIAAIREKLV